MSQLNQQLIEQLNKTPEEIAKLEQTEKKIGEIINWCCYNYQNSDKEGTFEKTKDYLAAVLTVSFFKAKGRLTTCCVCVVFFILTNQLICSRQKLQTIVVNPLLCLLMTMMI